MGHDEVELPVVGLVDLVDGADVGVVQRRGGLGFLEEALLSGVVTRQVGRKQFDGDTAIKTGVSRRIDNPHAAAPELRHDRIRPECRARLEQGHERERV